MRSIPCTLLALSLVVGGQRPVPATDFADQLPRIPPVAASQTLDDFEVADGFQIELVASEPMVTSPVAIEWDASGALYVCEMRGYSEDRDDGISRITRLVDLDNDGHYDQRTVFAEGLLWPTALFPYDGGLLVADAPHIYSLRDTDDDGVADVKTMLFSGFATSNVQGLLNCFRWGLDNRIHIACGTVGGRVHAVNQDESSAVEVRGYDLAFDPKTNQFSRTSGGGQHGMCFDDWGRKFVSSNSDHLQQVLYEDRYIARNPLLTAPAARQSIAADGPQAEVFRISPVEPWRLVRTRLRVAGLARGPIEGGGRPAGYFTGATGVTIYRGDAWPDQSTPIAFIGDVGSNLIHRKQLQPNGVPLIGRRIDSASEFVASTDIWFRPAQFACGPDGTLWVVDVYREVIEHPASLPPEIKQHLDLTSGRERGRIYRVSPDGYQHRPAPDLAAASTSDLANSLQHPNAWHRETAARLIYERQDKSVADQLRRLAGDQESALGRLHAMYALDGLHELHADDVIARLSDPHPQITRHAIRLAEQFASDARVIAAMRTLLKHPSLEVRYQLAFSLGQMQSDSDAEHSLARDLATILQQSPSDRWIQTAVGSSVANDATALFVDLVQSNVDEATNEFLARLAGQIQRQNQPSSLHAALVAVTKAEPHASLLPSLAILRKADSVRRDKELNQRADQTFAELVSLSANELTDPSQPESRRIRAIRRIAYADQQQALPVLVNVLRSSPSADMQLAALDAIGQYDSARVVEAILEQWPQWSPRLRSAAADVLFATTARTQAVIDQIHADAVSAGDFSRSRWARLATSSDPTVNRFAKDYLAANPLETRESVVEKYQTALQLEGDSGRGREVFKQHCAGCHQAGKMGHAVGPSLQAAQTRGPESILVNVLDPNREVNPQYINYVVLTQDGRTLSGMLASENTASITLRRAESATDTLLRSDIERFHNSEKSIMPEGFEKSISPQSMADLIAFLMQPSTLNTN
ncbi:c-type cytochrome [Stieleria sp. TO1_6]|uniref:PVC-type heme-binding CxxCH protein n=1 Tax=Stieleria tagensis TaxID=2956795 RepID=UPI00209B7114|nr:PVC-type heme-binding CxxCH protein [Stieleria tagensis]MCO8124911.1 c-type cytochrome [Stieleria tagensis]